MVDIYGRSRITREKKSDVDNKEIIKKIKDEISGLINVKDIDEKELVIFENEHGKLKTSNVSLDDLLMKNPTADDNSIVVFKDGKLSPSVIISSITDNFERFERYREYIFQTVENPIDRFFGTPRQQFDVQLAHVKAAIDNLALLRTEYDSHAGQFDLLKKRFIISDNVVEKFFNKKNVKPMDITVTLPNILDIQQKSINDIDSLTNTINNNFLQSTIKTTEIEKTINDIKSGIPKIVEITNKINISHPAAHVKQVSYVVETGIFDWIVDPDIRLFLFANGGGEHSGVYRFSLISTERFNLRCFDRITDDIIAKGVNVVIYNHTSSNVYIKAFTDDANLVRLRIPYILEYLGPQII